MVYHKVLASITHKQLLIRVAAERRKKKARGTKQGNLNLYQHYYYKGGFAAAGGLTLAFVPCMPVTTEDVVGKSRR